MVAPRKNEGLERVRTGVALVALAHVVLAARFAAAPVLAGAPRPLVALLSLAPLALALIACALMPGGRAGPASRLGRLALLGILAALFLDRALVLALGGLGLDPTVVAGSRVVELSLRAASLGLLVLWPLSMQLYCVELRLRALSFAWLAVLLAWVPGQLGIPLFVPLALSVVAAFATAWFLPRARARFEVLEATDLPPSAQAGRRPARRLQHLPPAHPDLRGSSL
jgi:hypothetical protein